MNTPKQYTHTPRFPINQLVDTLWIVKNTPINTSTPHYAPLFTELIFNYGDLFQVEGENIRSTNHYILSGLKTTPFTTTASGNYCAVGFLLKPYGHNILINHLSDKNLQLLYEVVYQELIEPQQPQFYKIESLLARLFCFQEIDKEILRFEKAISPLFLRKGALEEFSHSSYFAQKTFIQKFKKYYSLTPSQYIRLKQTNHATQCILKSPKAPLTHIALESGFYDQSHFIRTFKKHHGCTPNAFRKKKL